MSNREDSNGWRDASKTALPRRLEALMRAGSDGAATDQGRAVLMELQAQQTELERRGHELREAQEALALCRDRYERLFDLAPVGYAVFDRAGRIRDINRAGARMLRRSRSALGGVAFAHFVLADDLSAFRTHVLEVLDGDAAEARRSTVVRLQTVGGTRQLHMHSTRQEGDEGPECFSALVPITKEVEARHRQEASEHLRQSVLDAIPAEVVVLDRRGFIIAVNKAWQRFGENNAGSPALCEGVGLDYFSACRNLTDDGADRADAIADGITAVINGSRPHFVEEYPCHSPDRQRWFALTAAPVHTEPAAAVVVHFDITERKLAEDHARRARHAMAQAARVNAVGILAVSLIHELSQPLSAASFYSGTALTLLAEEGRDRAKLPEVLSGVDEQIKRAGSILQRLREFLRQRELHMAPVAIDDVIGRAMDLVRWFAADKQVLLRYARPAPGVTVVADPLQVEQVVINLVCNSIQAIDAAGMERREVVIGTESRNREVEVSVTDTGPGVPPPDHASLFDVFASTKDSGLGIGLAICRDVIELHNGKLWADPDPPEGAAFHFTLPRATAAESP
jgi:PAS domain S-box-containing protein